MEITTQYVIDYAKRIGIEAPTQDQIASVQAAMESYDEPWWDSNDPTIIAYHQLFEPLLIAPPSVYQKGLEALLERPVLNIEFGLNIDGLRSEANEAIERKSQGHALSPIERAERYRTATEDMILELENRGKTVVRIYSDE